jgi:hypothetical protein
VEKKVLEESEEIKIEIRKCKNKCVMSLNRNLESYPEFSNYFLFDILAL